MDEYAGRTLVGRYRLPRLPADECELMEIRAFDTYSGQEVLLRQLLLPEVVEAELDGVEDEPGADAGSHGGAAAQRALAAARAAAAIPDHPSLVQVFDVFTEGGSLWVVSELVPALPVAALIAERKLGPYRAAEIATDLLGGLRALHAHGWAHRNITARTVLVCDDGRAMLDGLALGAAEEALCGYDPVPAGVPAGTDGAEAPDRTACEGPDSALALERARQARITLVGPVAERWAPEQAGPIHENRQLAPPIAPSIAPPIAPSIAPPVGSATDLWALGSLLYRCVQGHPPFPEECASELVQLVCGEPPAFGEECGPLRPVVESLLRQDPAERPQFDQVRGRLRSLVRSAPEPDIGNHTVQVPTDPRNLPVVRRRGELVRLRRRRAPRNAPPTPPHGRHVRGGRGAPPPRPAVPYQGAPYQVAPVPQAARGPRGSRSPRPRPRRLGGWLLGLILFALLAILVYEVAFMPRGDGGTANARVPSPPAAAATASPAANMPSSSSQSATQTPDLGPGFSIRRDPAGFFVAVRNGWTRSVHGSEVIFSSGGGDFQLIVALGEGSAASAGGGPLTYQVSGEPQLAEYRASQWSSSSGSKQLITANGPAAEGNFSWSQPGSGSQLYAGNLVTSRGGAFDVVCMIGPAGRQTDITNDFTAAAQTFHVAGG